MDPKIDFVISVFFAKLDNVLITIASNVEVEQVLTHAEILAEHDDTLVEVIHLEQREQDVVIRLFCGVAELFKDLVTVFVLLGRVFLHHL